MKRSEMIKKFIEKADAFDDSGKMAGISTKEELTELMLTFFEDLGMQLVTTSPDSTIELGFEKEK